MAYHPWQASRFHGTYDPGSGLCSQNTFSARSPAFDATKEDMHGTSVTEEVKRELWEALGDSPIGASLNAAAQLVSITLEMLLSLAERKLFDGRF